MSDEPITASSELISCGNLHKQKSYILVIGPSGRQHNLVLHEVGEHFIFGRVGLERQVVLVKNDATPYLSLKIVDNMAADLIRKTSPGKIAFETGCVVPSETQEIRVKMKDVSLIEDTWRQMVPAGVVDDTGSVLNVDQVVESIPALGAYRLPTGQFVENPAAWPTSAPQSSKFKIIGDEDEGESEDE